MYGLRHRALVVRRQGRSDPSLLRWYPRWQLFDPHAFLDLTTVWEQAWVARWMAESHRAEGAVVELGVWLGATTRAITDGRRPGAATIPVHVYDHFCFEDIEGRVAGTPLEGVLRDGDSFEPLFRRRHRGHLDAVEVHRGDPQARGSSRG